MRGPQSRDAATRLQRYFPGACLVLAYLIFATLYLFGDRAAYVAILTQMGVTPHYFPFLDAHGVLATAECHRYGIDVISVNPCDILGRRLNYSPFWLLTAKLGLTTQATPILGLLLNTAFLACVFFLPRAHSWRESLVITAALLSGMVAFALERANLDLAFFVIAVAGSAMVARGRLARSCGYGLIGLAALVKYYPGAMLVLTLRERPKVFSLLMISALATAACLVIYDADDVFRTLSLIQNREWFTIAFGARNLPIGLASLLSGRLPDAVWPAAVELGLAFIATAGAVVIAKTENLREGLKSLPERSRTMLLAGCALIVGCFFSAANGPYRGIYFLLVLPGVAALCRMECGRAARQRFILVTASVLFLMWNDCLYRTMMEVQHWLAVTPLQSSIAQLVFWCLREVIWWWVVTILLAFLICLATLSETGKQIVGILTSQRGLAARFASRPQQSPASARHPGS